MMMQVDHQHEENQLNEDNYEVQQDDHHNHHNHQNSKFEKHEKFKIWQQNINGFYSKTDLIELLCKFYEPNVCLFQELYRSHETVNKNKELNNHSHFDHMYKMIVSHTGRAAILHKKDHNKYVQLSFDKLPKIKDKWNQCGFETVWVELKHPGNQSIVFCSLYRDGERTQIGSQDEDNNSNDNEQQLFDLQRFIDEFRQAKHISPNIIIGGDFNCKHWLWGAESEDPIGSQLAEFIWNHNLIVLNDKHWGPTCRNTTGNSGSYVDITLATPGISSLMGNWICGNYYYEIGSDHEPITCDLDINELHSKLFDKNKKRSVWNFDKADWSGYSESLETDMADWIGQFDQIWNDSDKNSVPQFEKALKEWYKIVNVNANHYVGKKQIIPRATRFWSSQAAQLKREVIQLNKIRKKNKNDDQAYQAYKQAQQHFKKVVKRDKKLYHKELFETINDKEKTKEMFSIVRRLTKSRAASIGHIESCCSSNNDAVSSDGTPVINYATTTPEKTEILANQFAKPPQPPEEENMDTQFLVEHHLADEINPLRHEELFAQDEKDEFEMDGYDLFEQEQDEMDQELDDSTSPQEHELQLLNRPITPEEVDEAIDHVGGWKASGHDDIHNQLLKQGGDHFIDSLVLLFNWSFKIGYMPKQWKLCNIAPIPKPGRDHTKAKNYRPIALLSCVGKIMERLFSQRLLRYLKETHLLSEHQAGFQSYHNTYELLLKLTEQIYHSFRNNSILEAVFLDISAAYDSVWRDGLRYKLRNNFQITGKFYWWIDSFLTNRKGRVVIDGIQSEWKAFETGVPQGSSLSPLLFIMYINDLTQVIDIESQIGMFADDVALWTSPTDNNIENMAIQHDKLQQSLDKIAEWCNKWKLLLAGSKTQYIVFKSAHKKKHLGNINKPLSITLNNNNKTIKVQPSEKVKYLGLYLDQCLTFKPHILEYLLPKVMKRVGWLKLITSLNGGYPHILVFQSLYKMLLRPAMDYACPFWNGATTTLKQRLDKIQKISLNRGLKLMKNVSYDATNVLNFVQPLEWRRKHEELKLFKRCRVYCANFPTHTLSQVYKYWCQTSPKDQVFNFKLSVLTRASINSHLYNIPIPSIEELEQQPAIKQMPQLIKLPRPTNTPFEKDWPDKHYDDVLMSFKNNAERTVIFTDGSCYPTNPGYGGAGIVIYPPHNQSQIELSYPMKNETTTNIAAEIGAIQKAVEWIEHNIHDNQQRIVLFSDCKPVINSILNRSRPKHYQHAIRNIQRKIRNLRNVPEIYWIKAHAGIGGNEAADHAAKRAARIACEQANNNNDNDLSIVDEAAHLSSSVAIGDQLESQWNKQWTNPHHILQHKHCKQIVPTIEFAKDLFHNLFVSLKTHELRVISRLISGHVKLRWYMNSITIMDDPYCRNCGYYGLIKKQQQQQQRNKHKKHWSDQLVMEFDDDPTAMRPETIEHYLLQCPGFSKQRRILFQNIEKEMKAETTQENHAITLRLLLTGFPCKQWEIKKKIVQHTISFVNQTNRMDI